jgi:succinate dehydrogenase / fumarate reductase cytochrome b subunit
MQDHSIIRRLESGVLSKLEQAPLISFYARTRGWPFLLTWSHRIAGISLSIFVLFHIYTLTALSTPGVYDAKMKIYAWFVLALLEWALAIPVIFHALNGARLILFENYGIRNDRVMTRWTFGLSMLYLAFLGFFMSLGNQSVSALFFWAVMLGAGAVAGYAVTRRIWNTAHSVFWKMQRISGAFLLVMIPAHVLFMHLNPDMSKESSVVIARMQSHFIKVVDLSMLFAVLFHAGCGLYSIARDYLFLRAFRIGAAVLASLLMLLVALAGTKLTLSI